METPREFIRRRKVELSSSDIMKKINEVVNIDSEVQILEEYIQLIKNDDDLSGVRGRLKGFMIEVTHRTEEEKQRWIPHYNHKVYKDEKAAHEAIQSWDIRYRLIPLYAL